MPACLHGSIDRWIDIDRERERGRKREREGEREREREREIDDRSTLVAAYIAPKCLCHQGCMG
jgi:hypothetical protein